MGLRNTSYMLANNPIIVSQITEAVSCVPMFSGSHVHYEMIHGRELESGMRCTESVLAPNHIQILESCDLTVTNRKGEGYKLW